MSIKCLECNKEFLHISATHLAKHNMTVAQYKEKHGVSPLFDPAVGEKISKKNAAKRPEVRAKISSTVRGLWEDGNYVNRINGMTGKVGPLSSRYIPENHTIEALCEKNYKELLSLFQDVGICSRCGKTLEEGKINIHHVDEAHSNFLPSNLEPLCVSCHMEYHYGIRKQNFIIITKIFQFAAAHRLPNHPGKCFNWHGHEWKLEVSVKKRIDRKTGMVLDFSDLKRVVTKNIINVLDHDTVNSYIPNSTAENILEWVWNQLMFDGLLKGIYEIRVWESPTSYATIDVPCMLSLFTSHVEENHLEEFEKLIGEKIIENA